MNSKILGIIALLTIAQASANDGCIWLDSVVAVGESVWVEDPFLVDSGAGRDWSGYRLQCVKTFDSASKGNLHEAKSVMVLVEHQQDFYEHVKNIKAHR